MRHLITVIGNIGGDYKAGFSNNTSQCFTNTIFESQGKDKEGNERQSLCFNFSVWDRRAEILKQYAPKGTLIALELEVTSKFGSGEDSQKIYTNFTCTGFKFIPNNKKEKYDDKEPEGIKPNSAYHGDENFNEPKEGDDILWD